MITTANDCKLDNSKSYATRKTLIKKLEELGFENQYGYVIVQNENLPSFHTRCGVFVLHTLASSR